MGPKEITEEMVDVGYKALINHGVMSGAIPAQMVADLTDPTNASCVAGRESVRAVLVEFAAGYLI